MSRTSNKWQVSETKFCGIYQCCELSITGEVTISGLHGEIWEYDDRECWVCANSSKIANKICKLLHDRKLECTTVDDEYLFRFPKTKLRAVHKIMKMPYRATTQLSYLNKVKE